MRKSPKHNAAYSFKRRNTNPENCSNVCSMAFAKLCGSMRPVQCCTYYAHIGNFNFSCVITI